MNRHGVAVSGTVNEQHRHRDARGGVHRAHLVDDELAVALGA